MLSILLSRSAWGLHKIQSSENVQLKSQQNATPRINVPVVRWSGRGRERERDCVPGIWGVPRVAISVCVISVLASRRQTSAITQPRDPANMSAYVRSRCARTARKTALAPVRLLLYNNYRLIKICYLTLR